jgi:spore maturation protein CgeB
MKILCVFGKNDYGNPSRGEGYEFRNFIPGFKALGHEVVHFDSWDRTTYKNFAELNQALLDCVEDHSPDIIFCVPLLYEIWLETLEVIKTHTQVKTILWCTDDSWKYREVSKHISHAYDRVVTTYPHILPQYQRDGISQVMLSQWAADVSTLHAPKSASQCRYPVVFVGAAHGDRKHKIRQLQKMGIEVQTFGYGWESGPVAGKSIPQIIRNAQVSLNFCNSKGIDQLKARIFEVPGAGGFLMTEAVDGIISCFHPGEEVEVAGSIHQMAEKIHYYLQNPEERDRIARKGFERTKKEHLYHHRFEKIMAGLSVESVKGGKKIGKPLRHCLDDAVRSHHAGIGLGLIKSIAVEPAALFIGKKRGQRLVRRVFHEIGWRFFGKKLFKASGWPGRMFYHES